MDAAVTELNYIDNDTVEYRVMRGELVIFQGTADIEAFDQSELSTSASAPALLGAFGGGSDEPSLGKVVAVCSEGLRGISISDAFEECESAIPRAVEDCYEFCLGQSSDYTSLSASICTLVQVLGRVQEEEERLCLKAQDRPEISCRRLAATATSVSTFLNLQFSLAGDIAEGLRTQDACPYADLSADSQCGGVSFDVTEECPGLDDPDDDDGKSKDDGAKGDGGDDDDKKPKKEPVVCDENSIPPNADCFNVINITNQGGVGSSSEFSSDFARGFAIDGDVTSSWFSDGNPDGENDSEVYTWTFGENVDIFLARVETDPEQVEGGGSFGFATTTVRVLDASGVEVYNSGPMSLSAFRVDISEAFPAGQLGRSVQLILVGHQSKTCGGFAEIRVFGYELIPPAEPEK